MLMKLDGIQKELRHGRSREDEFEGVTLHVRDDRLGVQLDVNIFPVYCTNCQQQLPHLYYADGSRYSLVGYFPCDLCGTTITLIDSDNIVEYHEIYTNEGQLRVEYRKLYKLDNDVWSAVKGATGYDIIARYKGQKVLLAQVITDICAAAKIDLSKLDGGPYITDKRFGRLPILINRWLWLLHRLKIA
ncbi:MAG: hypothetical protein K0R39_3851 [Symbiobacteriaceae bacterium]|jgi:hypothetical protein|nr:hypothetical protein [Symbiobacteriaceae bacterium]